MQKTEFSGNSLFPVSRLKGKVTPELVDIAARAAGCSADFVAAVWDVESDGRFADLEGYLVWRFEPATFDRRGGSFRDFLGKSRAALKKKFSKAVSVDRARAFSSTSWGPGQVMGFHARTLGYDTAEIMAARWASDPDQCARDWGLFVSLAGLGGAARAVDVEAFARGYNGPGNVAAYSRRLRTALEKRTGQSLPLVLSLGDRGDAVRELQKALGVTVDGRFGPQTRAALVLFQETNGLAPDGIAGARTWAALRSRGNVNPVTIDYQERSDAIDDGINLGSVVALATVSGAALDRIPGVSGEVVAFAFVVVVVGVLVVVARRVLRR